MDKQQILPLVKFSAELPAYIRDIGEEQDFIAEILEASQKPSAVEIALAVIDVIETWEDCMQDAILETDECSLCHGSGGAVEHHCMSCHGSGKRREYE